MTCPPNARPFMLTLCVMIFVGSTACGGRSTAQLSGYVVEQGTAETEYRMAFNDEGRISELEVEDSNGDITQRMLFAYSDAGNVREVNWEDGDGDEYKSYDFEWSDEGRLELVEQNGGDDRTEISYDGSGRVEEIERSSDGGLFDGTATTTYRYGDDGRLSRWDYVNVIEVLAQDVELTEEYRLSYDESGNLEEVEIERTDAFGSSSESNTEYEYDDSGRLIAAEDEANRDIEVFYDDSGRIDEMELADSNVDYTFEYAEVNSSETYQEPYGIPFSALFDLEGKSLGERDMRSFTTYLSY